MLTVRAFPRVVLRTRLNFKQVRYSKRYAPGLILTETFINQDTEVRDLIATVAYETNRTWKWLKPYRRVLLGQHKIRTLGQLALFIQTPAWKELPADEHKTIFEEKIEKYVLQSPIRENRLPEHLRPKKPVEEQKESQVEQVQQPLSKKQKKKLQQQQGQTQTQAQAEIHQPEQVQQQPQQPQQSEQVQQQPQQPQPEQVQQQPEQKQAPLQQDL